MALTSEEINHLAALSHLSLTEEERARFREQLSSVLAYVAKLSELDTSGVAPTDQVTGLENVWRDDIPAVAPPATRELLLENLPKRSGDLLSVPGILSVTTDDF